MKAFSYVRPDTLSNALPLLGESNTMILAGGTTQLDLMKCNVLNPDKLVDITFLPGMSAIEITDTHIRVGALVKMSELAKSPVLQRLAPAVYGSLWQAASPQIRNMATIGGNLRQRTRCIYFRDGSGASRCNKRNPGSGCSALTGFNRNHAILGGSPHCIAVYPGDLAVALTAFDASIILTRLSGESRSVSAGDFYFEPGQSPHLEHDIAPGEIITAIEIPLSVSLRQSHYLKVRDRASYEFAAASAAVGIHIVEGSVQNVRVALGGVGTRPWRARNVETALTGQAFNEDNIARASERILQDVHVQTHNRFKALLAPRVIKRALMTAGELV